MRKFWLAVLFALVVNVSFSQKVKLINSGEVIKNANVLYDSGKYAASIEEFLKVPERDTNYVFMLHELSFAYSDNQQYDKAIEICNTVLQKPTTYKASILKSRAIATQKKGEFDKAVALYESALKEFPTDMNLLFNLGIAYYNNKRYEKAADIFFQVLSVNPYHTGAHLNLAKLSIGQGRKVHAMFSMGMYLGISNTDNPRLVWLNNFLDNQVTDEGTIELFGSNASDKLDQIIRAKIAMEKEFKSKVPIDAAVVKQFELLFDQLGTISATTNDPWVNFYLPIFKQIKDQQAIEAFIYHILTSASNEVAKKWRSKNEKQLQVFFTIANTELKKKRERIAMPEFGFSDPVKGWYNNVHQVEAIGDVVNQETRTGHWIFFHNNNGKEAEGSYNDKGVKKGIWTYYHDTGIIKSVENYDTGEVTVYDNEGARSEHFFLKDDKIHGDVETYYPCGPIKEKIKYADGHRQGQLESYFPSGTVSQRFSYDNGKLSGEMVSYFENSVLAYRATYKEGMVNGKYMSYSKNGKVSTVGEYNNDQPIGEWTYYNSNGTLSRKGKYSDKGLGIGEWVYYDEQGILTEKRNYDDEGRIAGENSFYHDGVLYYAFTYKKDMLVKSVSYALDGKVISSFGNDNGTFASKYYYPTGELLSEGSYKKGKKEGVWKDYSRFGKVTSAYTYKDGLTQGIGKVYFASGELKVEKEFKDDELDGYYKEYYRNENVKEEGWFKKGKREQQWLTYFPDGTLEGDYYYLNNELTGKAMDYGLDGKVSFSAVYGNNGMSDLVRYSSKLELKSKEEANGHTSYEELYSTKKPRMTYQMACGKYEGTFSKWYPDGKLFSSFEFKAGKKEGRYENREMNNNLSTVGNYAEDQPEGFWKYYHENGQVHSEGLFRSGKRDSIWNYYFDTGKLSSTSFFRDGERHGITRYYSPEGVPILEKKFNEDDVLAYRAMDAQGNTGEWIKFSGTGKIELKYPNGDLAWSEEYLDGERHGYHRLYYAGGKLYSEYPYDHGYDHGNFSVFYSTGKLKKKGTFKDDEFEGTTETYNEDGTLYNVENYHLGYRHGPSTFYKKGMKEKEFTFWYGMTEE